MRTFFAYLVAIIIMAITFVQGLVYLGDGMGVMIFVLFFAVLALGGLVVKLITGEKISMGD